MRQKPHPRFLQDPTRRRPPLRGRPWIRDGLLLPPGYSHLYLSGRVSFLVTAPVGATYRGQYPREEGLLQVVAMSPPSHLVGQTTGGASPLPVGWRVSLSSGQTHILPGRDRASAPSACTAATVKSLHAGEFLLPRTPAHLYRDGLHLYAVQGNKQQDTSSRCRYVDVTLLDQRPQLSLGYLLNAAVHPTGFFPSVQKSGESLSYRRLESSSF